MPPVRPMTKTSLRSVRGFEIEDWALMVSKGGSLEVSLLHPSHPSLFKMPLRTLPNLIFSNRTLSYSDRTSPIFRGLSFPRRHQSTAPPQHNTDPLRLYRNLLREIRRFPIAIARPKMIWNVRELFELYRGESDPAKIAQLVAGGREDAEIISMFRRLPENELAKLYKKGYQEAVERARTMTREERRKLARIPQIDRDRKSGSRKASE